MKFRLLAAPYLLLARAPLRHTSDALAVTWATVTVPHKLACLRAAP